MPVAAVPLITAIAGAAGTAGSIASNASRGRADARAAEAVNNQNQDEVALKRAAEDRLRQQTLADLDIKRREDTRTATTDAADKAVRGSKLIGVQDIDYEGLPPEIASRMPKQVGGLRPSAITGKEEIGAALKNRAMDQLLNGSKYEDVTFGDLPELTPTPGPTKADSILNKIGLAGGIAGTAAGAYNAYKNKNAPVSTPALPPRATAGAPASYAPSDDYIPPAEQIGPQVQPQPPAVHPALRGLRIPLAGQDQTPLGPQMPPSMRGVRFSR